MPLKTIKALPPEFSFCVDLLIFFYIILKSNSYIVTSIHFFYDE